MQSPERKLYTGRFFNMQAEGSARSARVIVPLVMQLLAPKSVLDVGCGTGGWLHAFSEAGVSDFLGIDGDYVDRAALEIPADRFQSRDLKEPFNLGREFDLVISMEVAEHLPPPAAAGFVESLARHAPAILFSAAIPQQGGTGHLNERWQSYWIEKFANVGFEAIDCIRPRVWADPQVLPWYAQNAFLMVRKDAIDSYPALRVERDALEFNSMPADVVHPRILRNSLLQQDYKLRAELTRPTREHRALANNIPVWLDRHARDSKDAKSLDALRKARGELAMVFADANPDAVIRLFAGPLGQAWRQLIRSHLRYVSLIDAEREFASQRFPAKPINWSEPRSAGNFLGTSLYHFPHRFTVAVNDSQIPFWLREDVANYLAEPVRQFTDSADADAYARFALTLFRQLETVLQTETDLELRQHLGDAIITHAHEDVLALSQSPEARQAEALRRELEAQIRG